MEFPGGRVPFTSALQFIGGAFDTSGSKIPCYRTLDGTGQHIEDAAVPHELSQEQATQLYTAMAKLQVMDTICYDAQRQVGVGVLVSVCWLAWWCACARACVHDTQLSGAVRTPSVGLHVHTDLNTPGLPAQPQPHTLPASQNPAAP